MEYKAIHRFADVAPRKMRPFASMIRGKFADEALQALRFHPNRGARLIEKVLRSAIGNAEDRGAADIDDLVVTVACIDGAPMLKRIRPRARGTAYVIKKRYSHIRITVSDDTAGE